MRTAGAQAGQGQGHTPTGFGGGGGGGGGGGHGRGAGLLARRRSRGRARPAVLLAVAVAAVLAAGLAWQLWGQQPGAGGQAAGAAQAASAPAVPLQFRADEVVQPQRLALARTLEFSGPLVAPGTVVLRAKAAGTLSQLLVAEGDRVRAGQLLGRIELAELDGRLGERQAQLAAAQAQLQQAERQHGNNERLAAQQFISASALDSSRTSLQAAQAQVQAAQAQLAVTRVGQRDSQLLAPVAGTVARRQALAGERVAPEQAVLTLVDLRLLELAATVPTHEVAALSPGQAVQVQVEGSAQPLAARLSRIAPAAEPGTRAIGVAVALPNADERLRAGQYAVARLRLADPQPRLTLPESAVVSHGGQHQAWVLVDGRLQRRLLTLGRRDEARGLVEVLAGLDAQDRVLAARFDNLKEGAPAVVKAVPLPDGPATRTAASAAAAATTR